MGDKALKSRNFSWNNISSIGIGVAGLIDQENGRCLFLPNTPHWQNLDIVQELKDSTGVQNINLTDNVKAMAFSEKRYGSGKKLSTFLLFYIGAGIGVGMIVNNKLLYGTGPEGIMGEIGHTYVGESNEMCVCGNYGCLESMASGWAMVNKTKKAIARGVFTSLTNLASHKETIEIQDIIEAAQKGDKFAVNLIKETAEYLSIAISSLINLMNPQAVIIAGGLAKKTGDLLMVPLINEIKSKTIPWLRKHINVIQSELGEYTTARGTASLALDRFFNDLF